MLNAENATQIGNDVKEPPKEPPATKSKSYVELGPLGIIIDSNI
jgi:hypothetical protein